MIHKIEKDLILFSMGFFNEITNLFADGELDNLFKIECIGRSAVVVSGYKTISKLTEGEIELKLKKDGSVRIKGAKLYVKRIETEEVVVAGKIIEILL